MAKSSIEWTEETWNPTTGCNKVSQGCKNCYAERMSRRLKAMGVEKYKDEFEFRMHEETLYEPFKWSGSRLVFVNSMSDLFHEKATLEFIKKVFKVMRETPQHTYQLLTKRPERVLEFNNELDWQNNIWMGTSVERDDVKHRIDLLRKCDAKVKFLSIEPLIGRIKNIDLTGIDWVIVGGESGPGARPLKKEWVTEIKSACDQSGVPFFFKQWGKPEFNVDDADPTKSKDHPHYAKGGCMLDGEIYREMPV